MAKNPANRLDTARAKHAQIAAQIAEKQAARNTALLAGQEAGGIAKIDAELATLQHAARTEADRITLFEAEARREAEAAAVKRKASHINRFSKTLSDADALAVQVQDEILPALLAKVRKIAELRERARAGFAVRSSHANTAAASIEGAALSAHAVMAHLAYGFYRTSAPPFLGGRPGERVQPSLLGALCPRLELKLTPDKITPLATALRAASAFAVETLKKKIAAVPDGGPDGDVTAAPSEPAVAPQTATEQDPRSPAQARLGALLNRQAELAADPAVRDDEYRAVVEQIVAAQAEVDLERARA